MGSREGPLVQRCDGHFTALTGCGDRQPTVRPEANYFGTGALCPALYGGVKAAPISARGSHFQELRRGGRASCTRCSELARNIAEARPHGHAAFLFPGVVRAASASTCVGSSTSRSSFMQSHSCTLLAAASLRPAAASFGLCLRDSEKRGRF